MKKFMSLMLSVALLASLMCSQLTTWALPESFVEEQPVQSVILPSFSYSIESISGNQLTPEQLALPTAELVEYVLNYENLLDFFYVSSPSDPYVDIRDGFNGLRELEKRPDAASVLLSRFARVMELDGVTNAWEMVGLWFLLSHPIYCEQLSEDETEIYIACKQRYDDIAFVSDDKGESIRENTISLYDIIFPSTATYTNDSSVTISQ